MFAIAAALLALPYLPEDTVWRDGQLVAVAWPEAAWNLPDAQLLPFILTAEALGLSYAFNVSN